MSDNPLAALDTAQVASLRAWVEGREHADHDTFACGREFAGLLLTEIDRQRLALGARNTEAEVAWIEENERLRDALQVIAECDCHAADTAREALAGPDSQPVSPSTKSAGAQSNQPEGSD